MNFWGNRHLREKGEKEIVKESKKGEIIDRKKKNRKRVLRCLPFLGIYK